MSVLQIILTIFGCIVVVLIILTIIGLVAGNPEKSWRKPENLADIKTFVCICGESFGRPFKWTTGGCDRCGRTWNFETGENIKSITFYDDLSQEE